MQGSMEDSFGIPSFESTREAQFSDCADGRKHFRICNVPNNTTTKIDEGTTSVDVSDIKLQSGYTDHKKGVLFPQDGMMYVILFDLPSTYKIARNEVSDERECVLCGDGRPESDLGIVFGACGHYICQECSKEYKQSLGGVKKCFYCRRPTSVKVDNVEVSTLEEPVVGASRQFSAISGGHANMKQIMQRMQQL